jgi:hypothetical protein
MPFFIGQILELPTTTTQDYSLFYVLREYSVDLWSRQLTEISERHGLAMFIVHPEHVIERRAQDTYRMLLMRLDRMRQHNNVWIALPREVNRWWRDRDTMKLVHHNGSWHIEGSGSERARIAFAEVHDRRLTFSVEA